MPSPFHLAIPVDNLKICSDFYSNILECEAGRSSDHWIDYNMFGHQLVLHVDPSHQSKKHHNEAWYWAERENFKIWADQNGYGNSSSYTSGSFYDLIRNYRYNSASKKVKELIDKELPLVTPKKEFTFNETYKTISRKINGRIQDFNIGKLP